MTFKSYSSMIPLLIFSCFFTNKFLSIATDTISANQTLSGNQTIVSSGGNFELGFFTPGKSSKYYIGIWYKTVTEQTVVWVANRGTPVLDSPAAQLKILGCNLVLLNEFRIKIWSTDLNSTCSHNSTVFAVLLDSGNLVLQEKRMSESNSSRDETIWESFNYPTNTWMPGGKLGYDKRTGRSYALTSWRNSEDPSPGLYSLEPVLDDSEYALRLRWNKSVQYWTTGVWNGHDRTFSQLPEFFLSYNYYNYSYVNNTNESYMSFSIYNSAVISGSKLDISGQVKQFSWRQNTTSTILVWLQPTRQCEVYAYCGAFSTCNENSSSLCKCLAGFKPKSDKDWNLKDYAGGCVRETRLECQNNGAVSKRDKFLASSNVRFPSSSQPVAVGSTCQCESACLRNCSCIAYAYDENGCMVWNGDLLNLQEVAHGDGSGKTIHIRHSASSSVFHVHKKGYLVIVLAISSSIVAVMIILAIVYAKWNHRRQKTRVPEVVVGSLVAFLYKDLQLATKNFSMKLGTGGFGSVFKGTLPNSTIVAVKKLESINQGEKQFRTEVNTVGMIQHMNLVRLRGFCFERKKKLLVYDYMENGSLNSHLFNIKGSTNLDWKTRYQIALGIARGLAYLHEECRECIIHCDVKPENILLDANYCPKVGDFGLAKIMGRDFSRVLTTMRGTRGYLAPEWMSGLSITTKVDVYSYGKVLFELVSGSRNSEYAKDGKGEYFPYLAASVMINDGDILSLLDPVLDRDAEVAQVSRIFKIACWCIQDDENERPSMGKVVHILEGAVDVSLPPIPRLLQLIFSANKEAHTASLSNSSSTSNSEVKSSAYSSGL